MGILKVGKVSLDGTKVKASASKHILLDKAKTADNKEDNNGMNIPDEIARRKDRLEVIKAVKEKLTGKKPQAPKSKEPKPTDQVNLTDEESRIMPISGGGYMQAYNVQASVEHESRLIVHQHLTPIQTKKPN